MKADHYMEGVKKQFEYYKMLGDKTFDQLDDKDLFFQINDVSNSIAVIVKHIWGNMMSRWTNFLVADGEKEWRHRDSEFEIDFNSREDMIAKWEEGWNCLFMALNEVNDSNFETTIYIRNMGHSIVEAINRQLAHYSYHIGQIVYLGRLIRGNQWKSLSIPKGQSKKYNAEKFNQPKRKEHFTKEFLKDVE